MRQSRLIQGRRPRSGRMSRLAIHSQLVASILLATSGSIEPVSAEALQPDEDADSATAAREAADGDEPQARLEERVQVVGSTGGAHEATGSVQFIGHEELARQGHTDIQRILRSVPGVNLQDEEGYGLRPNIGLRGTGVERSQKVTLMEDGVLIAPAPYSAPAAYYFPSSGRMEAIEISKGPASIRQGPYTTGGVLNLISRGIPTDFAGEAELALGDDEQIRAKLGVGDAYERLGWSVESLRQQTQGFKRLDGGGDTGFDLEDYVAKLRVNSGAGASSYQSLELKLGSTNQSGDETYLGLTQDDFDRAPRRRYVASSADHLATDHEQRQLRYFMVPNPRLDLTATLYHNEFSRNWYKLQSVAGADIGAILADPDAPQFDGLIEIIRGEADSDPGALAVRNNRREYYSRGVQSVLGLRAESGRARHDLEFGLRYHEDEEDRYQDDDRYQMIDGSMELTEPGQPGSQSNMISRAKAVAVFARDTIRFGRLRIEPGLRFESIDFTRTDYGKNDPDRLGLALVKQENDVSQAIPGVGLAFDLNDSVGLFGGVHGGFAPPGPGRDEQVEPEESVNYELGVRLARQPSRFQTVAFFNDYTNLIGTDTASSGGSGTGDQFNGGAVHVRGLEVSLEHDFASNVERRSWPFRLAYTYTQGEFRTSFDTTFADWAPAVAEGDQLPYLPEHQLFAEAGWREAPWALFLSGSYVAEMRTRAGQGAIPENESIEQHAVFDASAEYRLRGRYRLFVQLRNLTDEIYVAARRPAGLRPGLPRSGLVGFGMTF